MRKLSLLLMSLAMIFLLMSCAMEDITLSEPDMYGNLTYSFNTLTFTETSQSDILYKTGNPLDDYLILCHNYGIYFDETNVTIYEALFTKLMNLSELSFVSLGDIFTYSTEELQTILNGYSIELSLNDVVIFNDIKSTLNTMKESDQTYLVISKLTYFEQRFSIPLNEDSIANLNLLQEYFLVIYQYNDQLILHEMSFEALVFQYEYRASEIPEATREKLRNGYHLVSLLLTL